LIKDIEVKLGESNEESAKAMEQKEESLCRQKELENLLNGRELESQLSALHLEIDNLLAEKDILIEEKESLRAKRTEALQSVRERISHADTELEDARKEKTAMDEKIKALKAEQAETEDDLNATKSMMKDVETKLVDALDEATKAKKLKDEHLSREKELRNQLQEKTCKSSELQELVSSLQAVDEYGTVGSGA
jgi:chromosome segregation ATPase